jgi:hypothetical protein
MDDSRYGLGSITYDTDTGMEWLDLTNTYNRSFGDVTSQLGPGGDFESFRRASSTDLQIYWSHIGIANNTAWTAANYQPCRALQDLVGYTEPTPGLRESNGFTAGPSSPTHRTYGQVSSDESIQAGSVVSFGLFYGEDYPSPQYGHWLVRSGPTVGVEPSTWSRVKRLFDK